MQIYSIKFSFSNEVSLRGKSKPLMAYLGCKILLTNSATAGIIFYVQRGIAQMVEQWSPKPRAEGSSPSAPASLEYH